VAVVGSGAAGISVALTAAARGLRVLVVTKDLVGGATPLAQGGLAAALGPGDTTAAHAHDTLTAGAGLCEPDVVVALTAGAPGAIEWLTRLGARLETRDLRLEGGHSAHRIVHSGDDATGSEVHRTLLAALLASGVEILDRTVALELLSGATRAPTHTGGAGTGAGARAVTGTAAANAGPAGPPTGQPVSARSVTGLAAACIGADGRLAPGVIAARAVVIAAGGLGQAFGTTSNPAGATGDGIAVAARAGAVIRDLEFVQFHPTVLWLPGASGQCPLVTEALRGAGAVLRDFDGTPLMAGHDPRGDLAPRDVVAARMAEVVAAGDAGHVWLDATALGPDVLEHGFPTVTAACRKHGIDPVTAMIPVAPGAHYSCGGIAADLDGRTSVPGLYAAGEAASTGAQGANRLASNSVTEAVIAGRRTGAAIADALSTPGGPADVAGPTWPSPGMHDPRTRAVEAVNPGIGAPRPAAGAAAADADGPAIGGESADTGAQASEGEQAEAGARRRELAFAMSRYAGVLRDADGLERLVRALAEAGGISGPAGTLDLEEVEAANLRTVSLLIAAGALRRPESRGCHRRRDAAGTAAAPWHTLARWDGQELAVTEEKL
jgi:L-aspartate oxidase